jgi:small toxic polypeptide LdrA/B/C/D
MTSYLVLAACFLLPAAVVQAVSWRRGRRRHGAALLICVVAVFALTAVFDSVMIAARLFSYTRASLLGWHIGLAPIEDFAYPLAAALLCTGLWNLFPRRGAEEER